MSLEIHARKNTADDPVKHRIVIRNTADADADIVHGIQFVLAQRGYLYHEIYVNGEFHSCSVTFPADDQVEA